MTFPDTRARPPSGRPRRFLPVLLTVLTAPACGARGGGDGSDPVVLTGRAEAAFPEDFGYLNAVRELADGRLLVADPLGKALYVVDMDEGVRERVGSVGEGPDEYLQPDATWPLPGDSTLLVDFGKGRLVRLDPDLRFGESRPIMTFSPLGAMISALPRAVDRRGRVYATSLGMGMGANRPDSGAIMRMDLDGSAMDTVGSYLLPTVDVSESGSDGNRSVSVTPIPYSPEDAWGVASDGSLVVARAADYRVEWTSPEGVTVRGEPVAYDPVVIGTGEKLDYVARQIRDGISIGVTQTGEEIRTTLSRGFGGGGSDEEPDLDIYDWPEFLPPFHEGRIPVDPEDRAWVRRHVPSGTGSLYDLFDREARRVASFALEGDREVLGFGARSVYVVRFDEYDLAFLERYPLPTT